MDHSSFWISAERANSSVRSATRTSSGTMRRDTYWRSSARLCSLLSLTVLRMIPVAIALLGERLQRATVAFVGWFGPRGLASIVFALVGIEALDEAGVSAGPLPAIVAWTVFLSIILHGLSARPLASHYGGLVRRLPDGSPEWAGDAEPRTRAAMTLPFHPTDRPEKAHDGP